MNIKLSKGQRKRAQKQKRKAGGNENTALKKNVETIVFQNPDVTKNLIPDRSDHSLKSKSDKSDDVELDLKKARFEVIKFSMNAMSGSEKVDAETAMAINLGAKTGKRPCVNYKELTATRKAEIERQKAEELLNVKPKPNLKRSAAPNHRKNTKKTSRKKDDGIISAKKIITSKRFKQKK